MPEENNKEQLENQGNSTNRLTLDEIRRDMETLKKFFTSVKLLRPEDLREQAPDSVESKVHDVCINAARDAFAAKGSAAKLEYEDGKGLQVTARYVEADGKPYVLQTIQPLDTGFSAEIDGDDRLYKDALTGAYNRRFYEEKLRRQYLTAGVAMIDLDDFKLYNDTFGHHAGDIALETAARIIQKCIRDSDYLIRYGGDELLLILPDITGDDFARKLRVINKKLHGAEVPGYQELQLSASIGGVLSAGMTTEKAVHEADRLMYQAKQSKNTVVTDHDGAPAEKTEEEKEKDLPLALIIDDALMNREILREILSSEYTVIEAANGEDGLKLLNQYGLSISVILLDIVMPVMDGLEVLTEMSHQHWLEDIPVIMISSEDSNYIVRRAYDLGAADYISRPFDGSIVYRRVSNIIRLYAKQRRLSGLVAQQFYEREKNNRMMINILSQVVELRNGESGLHVRHLQVLTEILLERVAQITDQYELSKKQISLIATASALHDIGKIAIDDKILNKPGRLTSEEYEIMKTHTTIGANMLGQLSQYQDEPMIQISYQICRWHHERYDGRGYPDGLKGDEIPFCAQVVALADAYDALVSERVYKKAIPHDQAVEMILRGECGAFNPMLLGCFEKIQEKIRVEMESMNATPPPRNMVGLEFQSEKQKGMNISQMLNRNTEEEKMTIEEVYSRIGADYGDVAKRLPSESLIARLAVKYLQDPTYEELMRAVQDNDVDTAFRAAHTLKGVCQNLGFTNMYQPVYDVTEIFRAGTMEGAAPLLEEITREYGKLTEAIKAFAKSHPVA